MNPSRSFRNPFPRPWMENTGAAAAAGGGQGLKGIVAGKLMTFNKYVT